MRKFTRILINLALLGGTLAVIGWVTTTDSYGHASRDTRVAILAAIVAVSFILACIVLGKIIPAKKKAPARTSSPYAAPAGRR